MANKGFLFKVIVPTQDGLHLADNFARAKFYLCYNLNELSYQLSEKLRNDGETDIVPAALHIDAKLVKDSVQSEKWSRLFTIEASAENLIEELLHQLIDNISSISYFHRMNPSGILTLE